MIPHAVAGPRARGARPALLFIGLLLIAANLRGPVTGVAPLLDVLADAFHLSPPQAGLLTTLPLLAFGVISPFAVLLAREYGLERTVFMALALIAAGIGLRSAGPVWALYAGTALIGAAIAVGNVLLPSLVKRDYPSRVPTIMGLTAITMGAGAALASAVAVPLGRAWGWQAALGAVVVLPVLALAVWMPQLASRSRPGAGTPTPPHGGRVWHSALAWQVTLFMGLNSTLYYVLVGWLPTILAASGYTPESAGNLHGVMQLASAVPGLFLGPLVARLRDQRLLAAGVGLGLGVALAGLLLLPSLAWAWSALFGAAAGAGVLLSLMFMGLRAGSAQQTAALSGMAQGFGYLLAATGPTLAGQLHDLTGGWSAPLVAGIVLSGLLMVLGLLAGRARTID